MTIACRLGLALGVFGLAARCFADGITVPNLVVFGDSLSDTGNAAAGTGGYLPGPATNYTVGRFTDGPDTTPSTNGPIGVWVDQVAARLGIPDPQPRFVPGGGTNFAVGGATTGTNSNYPGLLQAPGTDQQVAAYLAGVNNQSSAASLYAFWAGANDIKNNPTAAGGVTAADNVYHDIVTLAGTGAKNFLWFDLPPLGILPGVSAGGPAAVAAANAASNAFNSEWQKDLYLLGSAGILVEGVDIQSLFGLIEADLNSGCTRGGGDPYCFSNVTDSAQGQPVDPNTYLFWDGQHPTTAGQQLVADLVLSDIDAIPEPGSLSYAVLGSIVIAFVGVARARRRKGAC